MQTQDRIKKLTTAIDDLYANIYLWHQVDRGHQDKLVAIYSRLGTQLGIKAEAEKRGREIVETPPARLKPAAEM